MAPTIRPYRPEDRPAVAQVFHRAVREGATAYSEAERAAWSPSPDPDPTAPDRFPDQWTYVAEQDGRVTGFMSLRPDGFLDMAYVAPEVMGDGTADALYDRILARATAEGVRHLTVKASVYSRRFLLRRGWQERGTQTRELRGVRFENVLLDLELAP